MSVTVNSESYVMLCNFRHGKASVFLALQADSYIGQSVSLFGEYSESEVDVFRWFVGEDDICVDAGACFGAHTIALASLCPRGSVLAFEPQRIPFQILCANAQLNSMDNIDATKCALGADDGISSVLSLDPRSNTGWGLARLQSPYLQTVDKTTAQPLRGDLVRVRTLDSIALRRLDFLKIDVEGCESEVLLGGFKTIERCQPVIYVEFNERREGIVSMLRQLGYKSLFRHLAPVHRYPNFNMVPLEDVIEAMPAPSDMVLAIPDRRSGTDNALWAAPVAFLSRRGFSELPV